KTKSGGHAEPPGEVGFPVQAPTGTASRANQPTNSRRAPSRQPSDQPEQGPEYGAHGVGGCDPEKCQGPRRTNPSLVRKAATPHVGSPPRPAVCLSWGSGVV